jgi:hypothetical protein
MKTWILFLALFSLLKAGFSCSIAPDNFCSSVSQFPTHPVIRGTVIREVDHGIEVAVEEVYRGMETRSTITIWDGEDWECTGTFPMNAHLMAEVGQTVVLLLFPVPEEPVNSWERAGDYVAPNFYLSTVVLYQNGNEFEGEYYLGFDGQTQSVKAADLVEELSACAPGEWDSLQLEIRSTTSEIFLQGLVSSPVKISLYNLAGQLVAKYDIEPGQLPYLIPLSELGRGVFIFDLQGRNGLLRREKIFLQQAG